MYFMHYGKRCLQHVPEIWILACRSNQVAFKFAKSGSVKRYALLIDEKPKALHCPCFPGNLAT